MNNGTDNSTALCVTPVFDKICESDRNKNRFISLINRKFQRNIPCVEEAPWKEIYYGGKEKRFRSPMSRLIWLISYLFGNTKQISKIRSNASDLTRKKRTKLFDGDSKTKKEAEDAIKGNQAKRWMIFEGPTAPDVCIITEKYVLVAEGKQTEGKRTTVVEWDDQRDQLIRHMDAFLDNDKDVYGLFIYEKSSQSNFRLSEYGGCRIYEQSLKHRETQLIEKAQKGYLGALTWEELEAEFDVKIGHKDRQ